VHPPGSRSAVIVCEWVQISAPDPGHIHVLRQSCGLVLHLVWKLALLASFEGTKANTLLGGVGNGVTQQPPQVPLSMGVVVQAYAHAVLRNLMLVDVHRNRASTCSC